MPIKYDRRAFEIELTRLIQCAITDKSLAQTDVIAGLLSILKREQEIREYAMACQRSY